jgi:hypothetical protein
MVDSIYPGELDTDRELARVDDNITEIGGEAINGLRSAVFNIEETLGINPQGTAADVVTRLGVSLNLDGSIKASALSTVGLVTLPITNSMIATNAGIEESKLDLDYGTAQLKDWIDENRVRLENTIVRLNSYIGNLNSHVAHPSTWGRHYTSDIDGYAGTSYDGYNLQGIINDLDNKITNFINNPNLSGTDIAFDNTGTTIGSDTVQDALVEVDGAALTNIINHQDDQHSNGVLRAQEAFYNNTNHSFPLITSTSLNTFYEGALSVQFSSVPTGFGVVTRGDRLDITTSSGTFIRYVDSVNTSTGAVNFFRPITVTSTDAYGIIYRNSAEEFAPSSSNFGIRQYDISEQGGSIIQLVHQDASFILSNGIDVRGLTSTVKNIKIGWGSYDTGDIDAYSLMAAFNPLPSTWTVENLVIILNAEFRDSVSSNHFPLVAFTYNGELGIAVDEPSDMLTIMPPSGSSAWTVLGFSENEDGYALDRKLYIDGYEYGNVRKNVSGTAEVISGSFNIIDNISVNIREAGVTAPGLVRVKDAAANDIGTYVFSQINGNDSITVNEHTFTAGSMSVEIYSDVFGVPSIPTRRTLFELFLDGYYNSNPALSGVEFRGTERVEYYKNAGSAQDISIYFDVTDISRSFLEGERRVTYTITGTTITMALGTRGTGLTLGQSGPSVTLPAASVGIPGYNFRLTDYNGVDYIDLQVIVNYSALLTGNAMDLDIYNRPNEERYLQISKVLHNKQYFKHLDDRRLFGTVGRKDVRNDFTRDYTSYPRSILRGSGILNGFDVDSTIVVGTSTVIMNGGQSLTNGYIRAVGKKTLRIPTDGVASTYNLFINELGAPQLLKNDQYVEPYISVPSVEEIVRSSDKTMLWQITVNASNVITAIEDYRRYMNNLDNKVELIVEDTPENHGSFASLRSAVNYLNASNPEELPTQKTIKICGTVYHDLYGSVLSLPDGTTIQGDPGLFDDYDSSKIILQNVSSNSFIIPGDNCSIRDLAVVGDVGSSVTSLFGSWLNTILNGFEVRNCLLTDIRSSASTAMIVGTKTMDRCVFENCTVNFSTNAGTGNYIFSSLNDIDDIIIRNCDFTFSSLTSANGNRIFNISSGDLLQCVFEHSNVTFPTVTGTGVNYGIIVSGAVDNSRMIGNIFSCATLDTDNEYWALATSFDNVYIDNCKFQNFAEIISLQDLENVVFNNNVIDGAQKIAYASNVAYRSSFIKNEIATSGVLVGALFDFSQVSSVFVKDNNITIAGASDSLIDVVVSSDQIVVKNNSITSTVSITNFYKGAISETNTYIDGNIFDLAGSSGSGLIRFTGVVDGCYVTKNNITSSATLDNCIEFVYETSNSSNVFISDNVINNVDGYGIRLRKIVGGSVDNNIVNGCNEPLHIYNCKEISFKSNNLENADGENAVLITGNNSDGYMNFSDNYVVNTSTGSLTEHLVQTSSCGNMRFNNNIFESKSTTNNYGALIQVVDGSYIDITDNTFISAPDGYFHVAPIGFGTTPDNVIVASNNFRNCNITNQSAVVITDGTDCVDRMNWGQLYTVTIPISNTTFDHGGDEYGFLLPSSGGHSSIYINNTSNKGAIEFNETIVPVNAEITQIEIRSNNTDATPNRVAYQWYKELWNSYNSGTAVSAVGNPANGVTTVTLTSNIGVQKMVSGMQHIVKWTTTAGFSGPCTIYGVRVSYIL